MTSATQVLKGVVYGKTIELEREPGLPDGQEVTVTVQTPAAPAQRLPPGEGLRRSFGAWANDAEGLDKFLDDIRRDREDQRPGPTP